MKPDEEIFVSYCIGTKGLEVEVRCNMSCANNEMSQCKLNKVNLEIQPHKIQQTSYPAKCLQFKKPIDENKKKQEEEQP